eukprot:3264733-Amphidinium_carterae.11
MAHDHTTSKEKEKHHTDHTTTHIADQIQEDTQKAKAKAKEERTTTHNTTINPQQDKGKGSTKGKGKGTGIRRFYCGRPTNIQHRPTNFYLVTTKRHRNATKTLDASTINLNNITATNC